MQGFVKWQKSLGVTDLYHNKPVNRFEKPAPVAEEITEENTQQTDELANCNSLSELKNIVENFEGCKLKDSAINTVFADGSIKSGIMLVGEAPGANEDAKGIPFCGRSGDLLNNILLSIGLKREDVYITNTVFWRPPGNRRPTVEELNICKPLVEKHIALVKPKLIILVGSTAVEGLLQKTTPMSSIRGSFFDYNNPLLEAPIKSYVIFHPAYLLRQPYKKKLVWEDMLKVQEFIESLA